MREKKRNSFDSVKHALNSFEAFIEISILSLMFFWVWRKYYAFVLVNPYYFRGRLLTVLIYAFLLLVIFFLTDGLKFGYLKLSNVVISQCISIWICNFITYFQLALLHGNLIPPNKLILLSFAEMVVCIVFPYLFTKIYHHFYVPRRMVMVYSSMADALVLKSKLDTRSDKYRVASLVSIDEGFDHLLEAIDEYDSVIINGIPVDQRQQILDYCSQNRIRTYIVPDIQDVFIRGAQEISLFDTPLLHLRSNLSFLQLIVKRVADIILSSLAILILSPLMIIVSFLIKVGDGGPVFYKQERLTKGGKVFRILKFRSMRVDSEKDGIARLASKNDPRITHVGRFIRACRLDEIPQLFNILKGDMSIVGPRPERPEIAEQYKKEGLPYDLRLKVKAGLTGYAQIIGKYNTTAADKLKLDLMYIENYSLFMDLRLVFMTPRILFVKESTEGV